MNMVVGQQEMRKMMTSTIVISIFLIYLIIGYAISFFIYNVIKNVDIKFRYPIIVYFFAGLFWPITIYLYFKIGSIRKNQNGQES